MTKIKFMEEILNSKLQKEGGPGSGRKKDSAEDEFKKGGGDPSDLGYPPIPPLTSQPKSMQGPKVKKEPTDPFPDDLGYEPAFSA